MSASLPMILPYGYVSLYGAGTENGSVGILPTTTNILFAIIDDVATGMDSGIIGNSILFKNEDARCRLLFADYTYTILEETKIIGTENFL